MLNSILTFDEWTFNRWPSAEQRMLEMAGLDNPNGSPFMVGDKQRAWLKADLDKVAKTTPVVVFSHSPLQKLYKGWNFWTDDAEQVQALLAPFDKVNVIYGHVHQIQYNQIGNISFNAVMATAWPWPYPSTYAQAEHSDAGADRPDEPRRSRSSSATRRAGSSSTCTPAASSSSTTSTTTPTAPWPGIPSAGSRRTRAFQDPAKRIPPQIHY